MPQAAAFGWGAIIAVLGGLIGLGGAEFRLPVQAGVFKYRTLQAIVINLAVSLVTVIFSFIFRTGLVNLDLFTTHVDVILNILAGSLLGAYAGANFALRINERALTLVVVSFFVGVELYSAIPLSKGWAACLCPFGCARSSDLRLGL